MGRTVGRALPRRRVGRRAPRGRWRSALSASKVRRAAGWAPLALLLCLLLPESALAHVSLVDKEDVPLTQTAAAGAAGAALVLSFGGLSVAWRRPRLERRDWRALPAGLSVALLNPLTRFLAGLIGVFLLGMTIYAGLEGTTDPSRNFAVTFVFSTFWLGVVVLSVLFGDVFRAFNPWRAIATVAGAGFRLIAGQSAPAPLRYPERLGRWPAAAGLVGFVWLELIWGQGLQALQVTPYTTAVAALVYSAYTLVAMSLFGAEKWLERGETFSVYFGMFARISPFEVRDGRLGRRRVFSGLADWAGTPGSIALVLAAIGVTVFDGASEGVLLAPIDFFEQLLDGALGPAWAARVANTILMAVSLAFVAGLYWAGVAGMRTVAERHSTRELAQRFVHSFVPIALGYLVAHYFSQFVLLWQAQSGFLLSDPLGTGTTDLFGTAGPPVDPSVLGATLIWWVQGLALVAGHMIALVLAHDRALTTFGDTQAAVRSQYWMLALMVGFTYLGLYLLSVANS